MSYTPAYFRSPKSAYTDISIYIRHFPIVYTVALPEPGIKNQEIGIPVLHLEYQSIPYLSHISVNSSNFLRTKSYSLLTTR